MESKDNTKKKLRKSYYKCTGTCRYTCIGKGHELVGGKGTGTGKCIGIGIGIGKR